MIHHVSRLDAVDIGRHGPIPVTSAARTLIDLAAFVGEHDLEIAVDDGLRRGLFSMPFLRWRVDQLTNKTGIPVMRKLLRLRERGYVVPRSVFESLLRIRFREWGLPDPIRQHPIREAGRVLAVVDFACPEIKLAIETDGYADHAGRIAFERDRARLNDLQAHGWLAIFITWRELNDSPDAVAARINRAMKARGTSPVG